MANLKPWYRVEGCQPREDLRLNKPLNEADFAVNLDHIKRGESHPDYMKPHVFFKRTFMTKAHRMIQASAAPAQPTALAHSNPGSHPNTSSAKYPATNPHQGKFRVEVSRYLGNAAYPGSSSKAWYMLASPADLPVIEVAFLNGQEAPTIETAEQSFKRLGIQMRGYHDFGVALQDRSVTPLERVPFRWAYGRIEAA